MGAGKDTLTIADSNGSASDLDKLTIAGGGGDLISLKIAHLSRICIFMGMRQVLRVMIKLI
ncbi:hypothetical protein SynA1528_01035 [Synechococcus sp. A15-28]|nr:hypothetical protein SynA1528_01035 [Synechococcus sp. A15-28]